MVNRYIYTYECLYFQGRPDRLQLMKSNLHSLVHLTDTLANCGPGYVWWAFPGERYCGMLEGKAKNRVWLDASLRNALWLDNLLTYARLARDKLNTNEAAGIYPNLNE